jgi:hypothetical protein
MNRSESITELATALAKAQGAMPAVPKNGRGQVGTQRTSYVTFDDLVATVKAPLATNGLSFTQMLDEGPTLTTMLLHSSGQWIAASMPIEAMEANRGTNAMQALGSTLTYLKRYALAAMLGVASDEDDDAATAHQPKPAAQAPTHADGPEEPPMDAWDAEEQADGTSFVADTVKVLTTKAGKPYLMFTAGDEAASWFKGRDELLKAAPWIGQHVTKDQLAEGAHPLRIRVEYEVNGQYRNAVAFSQA